MTPCSAASSPFAAARTGCHGTILRSKTTAKRESRKPLVFPFCVLRRRVNACTRRSVLRQGAHSPQTSALRALALARLDPRSRRLGYGLSEVAAAEIRLVASQA